MAFEFNYTAPPTVAKFMRSEAFLRLIKGPFGSGKSAGCATEVFRQAIQMPAGPDGIRRSRYGIVRNCYDDQTEILTELRGWVPFKYLHPSDKVATRVNGAMVFELPSYYHVAPYSGDMINIVNEDVDLCVTPDHELWVSTRRTRKKIWCDHEHVKACDIEGIGELHRMTSICSWQGKRPVQSPVWWEFLGFWFAQGYAGVYPRTDCEGRHYRLTLTHRNHDRDYVVQLLSALGFTWNELQKQGCKDFVVSTKDQWVKDLIVELSQYGNAITKKLPQYIKDAPQEYAEAFIRGFQRGDGVFKTGKHDVDRLYSSSKDLINDLHEMLVRAGKAARLTTCSLEGTMQISPEHPVYVRHESYCLTIRQPRRENPIIRRDNWSREHYDGMVYCVTVPSHVVLVRRNGKAVWCGQTRQQLKDTTLKTWMDWVKPGIFGHWRESEMTFVMQFKDVYSEIQFRPLDSPEDVQRVLSMEWSGAWLNEIREIPVELLLAVMGRVGRYPRREDVSIYRDFVVGDTNPPEIDSAWYKIFEHLPLEENNPDSVIECDVFHQPSGLSPDAENIEHLKRGYYENLAKGKTKAWVDTYVHGKYSPSQSGKPVYNDVFKQERHVVLGRLMPDHFLPVIISFDCGLTPAARFSQMGLDGRVRVLREAVAFDMGMRRFAKTMLRPIIKNFFPDNPLIFIGDPAGKRRADSDESSAFKVLKDEFEADDAIVKAASTNDPAVRIQATEQMLSQYPDGEPLMVIDPSCKWYIEGLRSKYRYPKIKSTGDFSANPEKNNHSHIVEAGQYGDLYLLSGKYDPADHVRANDFDPLHLNRQPYRPAQREGY